jgi:hypothetical protein
MMSANKKSLRWLAVLAAMILLAGACSDDSSSTDAGSDDGGSASDDTDSDDNGSDDDSGSDDSGSDDSDSDDAGADDSGSDDGGSDAPSGTSFDCNEVRDALEAAGNVVADDPLSGPNSDDLQQSFNESRASLEALKAEAPQLSADIDQALEGLDVIAGAFASIDWDYANLAANPSDALEFVQLMSDPAVQGMTIALGRVSQWMASACT